MCRLPLRVVCLAALLLGSASLWSKDGEEPMIIKAWALPVQFFSEPNPSAKDGLRKPLPGVKRLERTDSACYDVSQFLKDTGVISFPPGSEATFFEEASSLVVRNTKENIKILSDLLKGCNLPPIDLAVEVLTYECTWPAEENSASSAWPTYAALVALPESDRKLLNRCAVATRSGQRASFRNTVLPDSSKPATEESAKQESRTDYRPGELGTLCAVDPVIQADGINLDFGLAYAYRVLTEKNTTEETTFKTAVSGWDGYPSVLQVAPSPLHEGRYLVVVASVSQVNPGGWKLPTPEPPQASPAPH